MTETSPRNIRDLVEAGELRPDQAAALYRQRRSIVEFVQEPQVVRGTYFDRRQEIARKMRHTTGAPIYAAVGAVDGVVDGISFGVSELAEDASFLVSRTYRKFREGWKRGQQRRDI
jgi:hypothetical protein